MKCITSYSCPSLMPLVYILAMIFFAAVCSSSSSPVLGNGFSLQRHLYEVYTLSNYTDSDSSAAAEKSNCSFWKVSEDGVEQSHDEWSFNSE